MFTFENPAKSSISAYMFIRLYVQGRRRAAQPPGFFLTGGEAAWPGTCKSGAEGAEKFSRSIFHKISAYMFIRLYVQFPALAGNFRLYVRTYKRKSTVYLRWT